jgi:hypothetical protein
MACTLYWPLARLRVPGEGGECCNSLSDFICRQIGEYKRRLNIQTDEDVDWEMTPWSLPITFQLGKPVDSTSAVILRSCQSTVRFRWIFSGTDY